MFLQDIVVPESLNEFAHTTIRAQCLREGGPFSKILRILACLVPAETMWLM